MTKTPATESAEVRAAETIAAGVERFDRVPLLFGSSPVHRLDRLSEHLGGAADIWAKREDCNSGLAYGGNKVRKLECLAADARPRRPARPCLRRAADGADRMADAHPRKLRHAAVGDGCRRSAVGLLEPPLVVRQSSPLRTPSSP
jgi:hypothetical protein